MSKLSRATQLLFGSTAGPSEIGVFGSLAAGSPSYSTTPSTIQSLANFLEGWFGAVVGENSPAIQDMNALFYLLFYQLCYAFQEGIPEWDSGTTYYTGSVAQDGSGNVYVSLQDTNLNHALSNSSWWALQNGAVRTVTTNTTIATTDVLIRSNSTSGSLTHTLPAVASVPVGKRISIKDVGSGSNTTSIKGNGSETIDGNNTYATALGQYDSITVSNNGTSWDVI